MHSQESNNPGLKAFGKDGWPVTSKDVQGSIELGMLEKTG